MTSETGIGATTVGTGETGPQLLGWDQQCIGPQLLGRSFQKASAPVLGPKPWSHQLFSRGCAPGDGRS